MVNVTLETPSKVVNGKSNYQSKLSMMNATLATSSKVVNDKDNFQ